jgi:hypothetical protein
VGLHGHLLELRGCPFRTLFVSFFTHPQLTFIHRPMSTLWCTWPRMIRPCTGSRHPHMFCSSPPSLPRTICQCVLLVMVHSCLHSCTPQLGHINVAEESIQDADSGYPYFPQHIPSAALEYNQEPYLYSNGSWVRSDCCLPFIHIDLPSSRLSNRLLTSGWWAYSRKPVNNIVRAFFVKADLLIGRTTLQTGS